jgi:thiamine biosynthesis lipoprotein
VGIRHPVEREKVARVVLATDLAVATSGTYEKGTHIYDPLSGEPVSSWLSLTVLGPSILEADVLATAAFAMGPAGLEFIEGRDGYEAYAIDPLLRAQRTTGFDAHCDPEVR